MPRLKEIEERLQRIQQELRNEDADLDALQEEIDRLIAERTAIMEAETRRSEMLERVASLPQGNVVRSFAEGVATPEPVQGNREAQNDGLEYRRAFMNYVQRGVEIPMELRADAVTATTDIGSVIPETVLNQIIEKMESSGMILAAVTRTNYKGGVKVPTSSVKPSATWVAEGAGSDKQKKTTGSISFAYNKLRCAVAVTLEVDTVALPVFESTLIKNVVEAMTKALEQSIISGDGSGKPKGILTETPETGRALQVAASGKLAYATLIDAEAALPLSYEAGAVWLMTKKTFMAFAGMVDTSGQPIARVNFGIGGAPERILLGRSVILNEYMGSYADTVSADVIFAALFNMSDYILNTNLEMGVKKYEDNDTDDMVTKAIMLVDGKVVDKQSLVTLTKKA